MIVTAEYIWMDGARPTQKLRSKTKVIETAQEDKAQLSDFTDWNFDGSSTYQASGSSSDLVLRPVNFIPNPLEGEKGYLVMCEVFNADDTPHMTNSRAELRRVLEAGGAKEEPWFGFEQEYTLFKGRTPLGWPEDGYPAPQGPFYCGVGSDEVFGRHMVEDHLQACLRAGLMIYGTNAEVMPGQWEFQIGPRGFKNDKLEALNICDHLWLSRWLLYRIGENYGVTATLYPKPVKGDWNGAGQHTNFSTKSMRDKTKGMQAIENAISAMAARHDEHIAVYGDGLAERLTGLHETCHITQFRHGVSDRGASIRIPLNVSKQGYGYLEDRRPGANADPYAVAARILKTICSIN
jgi:glutamine synthetase